jgi:ribosome-associated translation inhibitor RaiA
VEALNRAAQDWNAEQKSFDALLSKARESSTANQKTVQAQIQKANADLLAELKADKKYKDKLEAIDALQKQLQTAAQQAEQKFQQEAGPIGNEITKNKALIDGLTPVVRKENDLPASATFDSATQKWTTPKVEEKAVEPKK